MDPPFEDAPLYRPVLLLFGGGIGLLLAVLAAARSQMAEKEAAPGRRAISHWLPIAAAALVAVLLGRAEIAIGVIFGTSVALLSAVVGFVSLAGAVQHVPERSRRFWMFLPVATVLAFVIGFRGTLGPVDAGLLAAQGVLAWLVWSDLSAGRAWGDEQPMQPSLTQPGRWLVLAAALLLAAVSAWAATRGAEEIYARDYRFTIGVMAATILSLVLALPMVSTGAPLAAAGRAWAALTAQVAVVFLNLCLLLPIVIAIAALRPWAKAFPHVTDTQPIWTAVLYPRTVWRIDAIALIILSLVLVPVANGRMRLDRQTGGWLAAGYLIYLLAVLVMEARS